VFFSGNQNKRLAVNGLNDFPELEKFLNSEAQTRDISMQKIGRAVYLPSKNTETPKLPTARHWVRG
jgi:hypothetical protein